MWKKKKKTRQAALLLFFSGLKQKTASFLSQLLRCLPPIFATSTFGIGPGIG